MSDPTQPVDGFLAALYYSPSETVAAANTADDWVEVAKIVDFTLPEPSTADVDSTHFKSAGRHRTYKPGLTDPGAISVDVQYSAADRATLNGRVNQIGAWRVLFEDDTDNETHAGGFACVGYLKPLGYAVGMEENATNKLNIKVSGPLVEIAADTTPAT